MYSLRNGAYAERSGLDTLHLHLKASYINPIKCLKID